MPTAQEVIAAINGLEGDERKAFEDAVAKDTPEGLKKLRSRFFAAGKRDVETTALKALNDKVAELEAEVGKRDERIGELEKSKPDLAERDAGWQRKVDAARRERDEARAEAARVRDEADAEKFRTALHTVTTPDKRRLHPEYAALVPIKYQGRIRRKDDGTRELLDADGVPVEIPKGKTLEQVAAEAALAEAPPEFVLTGADAGGGVGGGGAGARGKPTREAIIERKQLTGEYAL